MILNPFQNPGSGVIVLEALDGVGKSTAAKSVADMLGGVVYNSSHEIKRLRLIATKMKHGSIERTEAFYTILESMSNEIHSISQHQIVIVDRFYASWASDECGLGRLKLGHLSRNSWPSHLLKPDLCVHLRADEPERISRMNGRSSQNSREIKLADDDFYRQRVLRAIGILSDVEINNTYIGPEHVSAQIARIWNSRIEMRNSVASGLESSPYLI